MRLSLLSLALKTAKLDRLDQRNKRN